MILIDMRQLRIYFRAKRLKDETALKFDGVVHNCCKISENNPKLAFIVYRIGVFGHPMVEQITRPNDVKISEDDNFVVVKDGYAYELRRAAR